MATNQYFKNYTATNEQSLLESLVIEAIQIKGMDVKYIPRTLVDFDKLLGEDPNSAFLDCREIEMYLEETEGFGGEHDLFTKFGYMVKDTSTFICSMTRFKEEFPHLLRPFEGDLIYIPVANSIMEIKYVQHEEPFYQNGQLYTYKLKCETFEFSQETYATGDSEIDSIINSVLSQDPENEVPAPGLNNDLTNESPIVWDPSNPFGVR